MLVSRLSFRTFSECFSWFSHAEKTGTTRRRLMCFVYKPYFKGSMYGALAMRIPNEGDDGGIDSANSIKIIKKATIQ